MSSRNENNKRRQRQQKRERQKRDSYRRIAERRKQDKQEQRASGLPPDVYAFAKLLGIDPNKASPQI